MSESDDDEFESADEGDETTDESCNEEECTSNGNISAVQTESTKEKEEIPNEKVQENQAADHRPTGIVDPSENSEIPGGYAKEVSHHKELQDVGVTSVENQIVHNRVIPCPYKTLEKTPTGDVETYQEDQRTKTTELPGNDATDLVLKTINETILSAEPENTLDKIPTGDVEVYQGDQRTKTTDLPGDVAKNTDTNSVPQSVNETNHPAEAPCEDLIIPSEIVNKISTTRNISNHGKIRSKPTLGAKKLGAVKLTQPHESPAAASPKIDSKEMSREVVTSTTAQEASTTNNPSRSDDGWGWFAPPKSLMSSVASLTNQILSTVENGLNIPEPEDLAKEEMLFAENKVPDVEDKVPKQITQDEKGVGFTQLFGGVSNITKFVENTGSSLFSTGLDTLELLGKKTINVLQQSDPGLKRTKAVLANPLHSSQNRPCLSQVLREAKEVDEVTKCDSASAISSAESEIPKLSSLFEFHNGIVHLEALEMLSQQYQNRFAPQIRRLTSQRKAVVDDISMLCSRTDDYEDNDCSNSDMLDLEALEQNLSSYFDRISLELSIKKLMNAFREGMSDSVEFSSPLEVYRRALDSLALVTSLAVELFHKGAELILMACKPSNPAVGARLEAETFQSVTSLLATEISKLGSHHANQIVWATTNDHANYSTDIYYEASNCRSYLENALKLMIPILQSRVF